MALSEFERGLLSAVSQRQPPPPPPTEDENEIFFRSLLPSMARLTLSRRARVRFRVHQLIFQEEQEQEAELEALATAS